MAGVKERLHRTAVPVVPPPPRRTDGVQKAHPDAGALPFRHDDQAARSRFDEALSGRERDMSDRLVCALMMYVNPHVVTTRSLQCVSVCNAS
jgi:hypothetical protein